MIRLQAYFDTFLPLIEADLKNLILTAGDETSDFVTMMRYHMGWVDEQGKPAKAVGGKRLRPMLSLLIAEAIGGEAGKALPAAVALELIHNFSLLHDDIEDQSKTRRGRPTVWSLWGEAQAINTGDAMFALAHRAIPYLGETLLDDKTKVQLMSFLSETCLKLTHGQYLDISFEKRAEVTPDEYLEMIRGKTGAMIAASAAMGAISGGANEDQIEALSQFGLSLGLAFQIQDDLLDIWGNPEKTGKARAADITQKKKSYPLILGLMRRQIISDYFKNDRTPDETEIEAIIRQLEESHAHADAEALMQQYTEEALTHLKAANLDENEAAAAIRKLVEVLLDRDR